MQEGDRAIVQRMTGWLASAAAFGLLLQTASPSVPALDAIDKDISAGVYGNVDRTRIGFM